MLLSISYVSQYLGYGESMLLAVDVIKCGPDGCFVWRVARGRIECWPVPEPGLRCSELMVSSKIANKSRLVGSCLVAPDSATSGSLMTCQIGCSQLVLSMLWSTRAEVKAEAKELNWGRAFSMHLLGRCGGLWGM